MVVERERRSIVKGGNMVSYIHCYVRSSARCFICLCVVGIFFRDCCYAHSLGQAGEENTLETISVKVSDLSTQLRIGFQQPFLSRPQMMRSEREIRLFFPRTRIGKIERGRVVDSLKAGGLVADVRFEELGGGISIVISLIAQRVNAGDVSPKWINRQNVLVELYSREELARIGRALDGPLFTACCDMQEAPFVYCVTLPILA